MIFRLKKSQCDIQRVKRSNLSDIGWKEEDFQRLLFENLEKVLQDDELLLIMHSRKWQEEPDLMAVDSNGDLYIFELKAWESQSYNLLQALRYGQIFGQYSYDQLNDLFERFFPKSGDLLTSLNSKFEINLSKEQINRRQHFIIITNGLDFRTRQAILYWSQSGIDIRSWIYRVYKLDSDVLVEFNMFRVSEDPFEDIEQGYYVLNTNYRNDPSDDEDMIKSHKAAAYFDPWKRNIEKLKRNDRIFLYRSGTGIVATGLASGKLEKKSYHGEDKYKDEEYSMKLSKFKELKEPLTASDIRKITGKKSPFRSTMCALDKNSGDAFWEFILKHCI